jgi:hypothetical protein
MLVNFLLLFFISLKTRRQSCIFMFQEIHALDLNKMIFNSQIKCIPRNIKKKNMSSTRRPDARTFSYQF